MTKIFRIMTMIAMLVALPMINACSSSDDGGELQSPEYDKDAALYEISNTNSAYKSIELTESGNYVIIMKNATDTKSAELQSQGIDKKCNFFSNPATFSTRSDDNGVISGKYTKKGEDEYYLEDFGTIKVVSTSGSAVDLDITTLDGTKEVIGANRRNMYSNSAMTDKLCRTWKFEKIHYIEKEDGKTVASETITADIASSDEYDEFPVQVIFTRSGTYMVFYTDGELAISTWTWDNESAGILRFSWDYDHLYDPDESGTVKLEFQGNKLVVTEEEEYEQGGVLYYDMSISYLVEA